MKIEWELKGFGHDGDILVVDGMLPNLRTEAMPAYVQTLPKAPRLKKDQRAVLVYEGKEVKWHIREPKGITGNQSFGISFLTFVVMYAICRKLENKYFNQKGDEE